jgi:hypothetical protein
VGVWCIYRVCWKLCAAGERESGRAGGGGKGGERENIPSSKPLDKHITPIDRHYNQEVMTEVSIQCTKRSLSVLKLRLHILETKEQICYEIVPNL